MRGLKAGRALYVKVGLIVAASILLAVVGIILLSKFDARFDRFPEHEIGDQSIEYNGKKYVLNENVETFLIIGLDKFEGEAISDSYNNDMQADFLMLLIFDNAKKECSAIHINRDTMADINVLGVAGNKINTVNKQIALSHTYGDGQDVSCRNTSDSVSSLLKGMKVNHYISVTMDAVATLNDLVGGVQVDVIDDFSGVDETLVKGETVTLMGEHALNYVRARKNMKDNSNSARMKRQQQYVNALHAAMKNRVENDDGFVVDVTLKISDYIVSDRSVTQLQTLVEKFNEYNFTGIKNIEGNFGIVSEHIEFYPSEESINEIVVKYFYKPKE